MGEKHSYALERYNYLGSSNVPPITRGHLPGHVTSVGPPVLRPYRVYLQGPRGQYRHARLIQSDGGLVFQPLDLETEGEKVNNDSRIIFRKYGQVNHQI